MYNCRRFVLLGLAWCFATTLPAQDDVPALSEAGEALFFERISCRVCHGEDASGLVVRDQGGFHHGIHPARGMPLLD